jgi:hypothetical protein
MGKVVGLLMLLGAAIGSGCAGPSLDVPELGEARLRAEFEPATADGFVPLVFRARLRAAPASGKPWLFRGEVSEYYARALKRGELPTALHERAIALRFWHDADDCWLQPLDWLEPDATYTLAFTGSGVVQVLLAQAAGERPARRVFPPIGSHKYRVSVWCDLADEGPWSPLTLEPGSIAVRAAAGIAGYANPGCATLHVEGALTEAVVAPPLFAGAAFEPSPWLAAPQAVGAPPVTCAAGVPFFGACLEVLDDRLLVTPMAQDLLFALTAPRPVVQAARAGTRGLLLRGLPPNSQVELIGSVLSSAGAHEPLRATFTTGPARRHVVLNEVLANPAGPEPDAEWLELVNDSDRPTSLSDLWLEDSSGHVRLPDAVLGPGEIALIVGDGFRTSGVDVPVPDGVRLLRVPSLGARGLSNQGEGLLLVGPEGVVSRFPLLPAPHAGQSLARRTLDGSDDDRAGFAEQSVGATPGAPNVFDP